MAARNRAVVGEPHVDEHVAAEGLDEREALASSG